MLEVLVDWEIGRSGDRESDQQLHEDCGGTKNFCPGSTSLFFLPCSLLPTPYSLKPQGCKQLTQGRTAIVFSVAG
ncbi:hypothetical protein [Moorena producens]|uniref:hypothetical protein n=1 Tax=Moorena producens TaxID=1155739 RepID=UPI0011EA61A0|nr:hypothetical protein [Moorena producens]